MGWVNSGRYDFAQTPGLVLGANVTFTGVPLIQVTPGALIRIGDDVTINSENYDYHVNMHSPVKLMADRSEAIIEIGAGTRIHGTAIHAWKSIRIGKKCLIAANCQIMDASGHELCLDDPERRVRSKDCPRPVVIEDAVWIGANSIILPGVTIGRGSVIGSGSVVTGDIPPMVLAAGNPARVVCSSHDVQPA